MSHVVSTAPPTLSAPLTAQGVPPLFHALRELATEYVRQSLWPDYAEYLAEVESDTAAHGAFDPQDLVKVLREVSFVTEGFLVENNWRAYRKHLTKIALAHGLDLSRH